MRVLKQVNLGGKSRFHLSVSKICQRHYTMIGLKVQTYKNNYHLDGVVSWEFLGAQLCNE